jgi:hypothetical protein
VCQVLFALNVIEMLGEPVLCDDWQLSQGFFFVSLINLTNQIPSDLPNCIFGPHYVDLLNPNVHVQYLCPSGRLAVCTFCAFPRGARQLSGSACFIGGRLAGSEHAVGKRPPPTRHETMALEAFSSMAMILVSLPCSLSDEASLGKRPFNTSFAKGTLHGTASSTSPLFSASCATEPP